MDVFKMKYYSKHSQVIFFQEEIKPVVSRNKLYQDHIQNENETEKRNGNRKKITIVKVLVLKCSIVITQDSHQAEDIFFHKYISSLFPL